MDNKKVLISNIYTNLRPSATANYWTNLVLIGKPDELIIVTRVPMSYNHIWIRTPNTRYRLGSDRCINIASIEEGSPQAK